MKLIDIITSQWAMMPEKIHGLLEVVSAHSEGGKLDLKSMEKALLDYNDIMPDEEIETISDIAVINISGMLMKRPTAFERILFDAVSMEKIQYDIEQALNDPSVETILLNVDSPGGTVDGTKELADFIYAARDKKKIIAFSDGMICSAAYWIASAAHEIYVSSETVNVGSIGVITTHVDMSAYNEGMGIKVTDIYSGEFKAAGSQNKPLDEKSTVYIQDRIDYIYAVFVNDVARNRGQSTAFVMEKMAGGKVHIGGNALRNKLIDGVQSYEKTIGGLSKMDRTEFRIKHEAEYKLLCDEIEKDMSAKFEAQKSDIELKALETERKRISDIQAISLPGYEKVISEGIEKGMSASDVSIEIIKAQKESLKIKAEAFDNDGADVLPEVVPAEPEPEEKPFLDQVKDHAKANKCSVSEARAAVIKANPKAYEKFLVEVK